MMKNPMQPLIRSDDGVVRFKANKIVRFLLDSGKHTLNDLAKMPFDQSDFEQLFQLLGYSVCGFSELSGVSESAKDKAWKDMQSFNPAPVKRQKRAK